MATNNTIELSSGGSSSSSSSNNNSFQDRQGRSYSQLYSSVSSHLATTTTALTTTTTTTTAAATAATTMTTFSLQSETISISSDSNDNDDDNRVEEIHQEAEAEEEEQEEEREVEQGDKETDMTTSLLSHDWVPHAASTPLATTISINNTVDSDQEIESDLFQNIEQLVREFVNRPNRHYPYYRVMRWTTGEQQNIEHFVTVIINKPTIIP